MSLRPKFFIAQVLSVAALLISGFGAASLFAQDEIPPRKDLPPPSAVRCTPAVKAVYGVLPSTVSILATRIDYPNVRGTITNDGDAFPEYAPRVDSLIGSGFFITDGGIILTCAHLVDNATTVRVTTTDRHTYTAEILAVRTTEDIALIRIQLPEGVKAKAVQFAPPNDILLGETAIAVGNPIGYHGTVSTGIISGASRRLLNDGKVIFDELIQLNIPTHNGASGSPVVNLDGDIIGMMILKYKSGDNIGFALPVENIAQFVVNDAGAPRLNTRYNAGILFKRETPGKWRVRAVSPHSPFADAVNTETIITAINDISVADWSNAVAELWALNAENNTLRLTDEHGEILTRTLTPKAPESDEKMLMRRFGIAVESLSTPLALAMRYIQMNGVIVTHASPLLNLKRGHLIMKVNQKNIYSSEDFAQILRRVPAGGRVSLSIVYHDTEQDAPGVSIRTVELTAHE